jgi:hypothetical protein
MKIDFNMLSVILLVMLKGNNPFELKSKLIFFLYYLEILGLVVQRLVILG